MIAGHDKEIESALFNLVVPVTDDAHEQGSQGSISPRKRKRTHATRSCLACRKRKVRCALPDVGVPSSLVPLQKSLACTRCTTMELDCVVWDGDRKSKRYTAEGVPSKTMTRSKKEANASPAIDADAVAPKRSKDEILAPFYPYDPSFRATPNENGEAAEQDMGMARTGGRTVGEEARDEVSGLMNGSISWRERSEFINIRLRPMRILTQLLGRQDLYKCGLPADIQHTFSALSPSSLLDGVLTRLQSSPAEEECDYGLLAFHCHLPRLQEAIERCRGSASNSSRVLLACTMIHLCRAHPRREDVNIVLHLIRHHAMHIFLRAPRHVEAAQALELIAVHMPFILHTVAGGDAGGQSSSARGLRVEEDCPPAGVTLLGVASDIASALRCDKPEFDSDGRRKTLWASLCAWSLVMQLYEMASGSEIKYDPAWLMERVRPSRSGNEIDAIRQVGRAALQARLQSLIGARGCCARSAELADDPSVEDDLYKATQISIMNEFQETQRDEHAYRQIARSDLAKQRMTTFAKACAETLWLWTDLEAMALHQNALARAIGDTYVRFLDRTRASSKAGIPFSRGFSQLWKDPAWSEHISVLGKRRNDEIIDLIAKACHLGNHVVDSDTRPTLFPMLRICATVMMAAKTMLDSQSVILHHFCHLLRETEAYIVLLQRLAAVLDDARLDVLMPSTGERATREAGLGQCTSKVLMIVADTMADWQDRQNIVLARHRIAEKKKTQEKMSSAMQTPSIDSSLASLTPASSAVDDLTSLIGLDPLFEGILEMPALEELFQQHFGTVDFPL